MCYFHLPTWPAGAVKVKDAPDLNAKMEESSIAPPELAEVPWRSDG
jgi:hypothetical protein